MISRLFIVSVIDKMEQNNFIKLVWVIAFVAFAAVSCWATAESLHLLLSSWPLAMCWVVSVGFFLIASLGSKMIVDSLNQNIYMEKRGVKLAFGTVLLLVFWLACMSFMVTLFWIILNAVHFGYVLAYCFEQFAFFFSCHIGYFFILVLYEKRSKRVIPIASSSCLLRC